MTDWLTVSRPGYFGAKRDAIHADYTKQYGEENHGWRLAWSVDGNAFNRDQMNMLYEDSYFAFLQERTEILRTLIEQASDVYDDAPSNMKSGFDYSAQETDRTHVQDISIRRVVSRLGLVFQGDKPIQIRDHLGNHPLSHILSPGRIPFHRPDLLIQPELEGWWLPGSVESFYQSNKILQVKADEGFWRDNQALRDAAVADGLIKPYQG